MNEKTDLAVEAKQIWERSAEENTKLEGVAARQTGHFGIPIDVVEILDERGEQALGKPRGTYVTVSAPSLRRRTAEQFRRTAEALTRVLRGMTEGMESVLVVGLGNRDITPDAVGPMVMPHLIVTRHLVRPVGSGLGVVSAMSPGVLGSTGMESLELVQAALKTAGADCVLVVDALASCEPERLCATIQVTDTGLVPGSGIRNPRSAFSRKELGVPVIAVGVPTVVDGGQDLILTPRSVDHQVRELGKLIACGINLAFHRGLEFRDLPLFLS